MRIRVLVLTAAIIAPAVAHAQVRLPRSRPPVTEPQPLPPTAGPVAQDLILVRARWSFEGYPLVSNIQAPIPGGGTSSFSTLSFGTHGDYRYTDRWAGTADMTATLPNGGAIAETFELGTRFRPLNYEHEFRPLFDLRGGYMRMYDTFLTQGQLIAATNGEESPAGGRYSRGFGAIAGAGFEYTLTSTVALVSEVSAMRNRMTMYDVTGPTSFPTGSDFWMTSMRFTIGLKYNPVHYARLADHTDSK